MQTVNVNDPGVAFEHAYTLPDGVTIPALHPKDVEMTGGAMPGADDVERLREGVASTVAEKHRRYLADLGAHALMVMQHAYAGWCAAYYRAVAQGAVGGVGTGGAGQQSSRGVEPGAVQSSKFKVQSEAPELKLAREAPIGNGTVRRSFPAQVIRPGGHLPAELGGHPVGRAKTEPGVLEVRTHVGDDAPLAMLNGVSKAL